MSGPRRSNARRLGGPDEDERPPTVAQQLEGASLFADPPAPAPSVTATTTPGWLKAGPDLSDVDEEIRAAWYAWLETDEGVAVVEQAGALARAAARESGRLFIDKLIWRLREQTPPRQVNNNLRSCLARYLMWRWPEELKDRFQVREYHRRKAS